jgi:hypothetical protein
LDLAAIAERELGESFTPGWLTANQVLDVLRQRTTETPVERLEILTGSQLLEVDARNTELIRITLDPIAEHLVARSLTESLAANLENWREFLKRLQRRGNPAGLRDALRECLGHRVYGRAIPREVQQELVA